MQLQLLRLREMMSLMMSLMMTVVCLRGVNSMMATCRREGAITSGDGDLQKRRRKIFHLLAMQLQPLCLREMMSLVMGLMMTVHVVRRVMGLMMTVVRGVYSMMTTRVLKSTVAVLKSTVATSINSAMATTRVVLLPRFARAVLSSAMVMARKEVLMHAAMAMSTGVQTETETLPTRTNPVATQPFHRSGVVFFQRACRV
jgi:hypothetical protein